MITQLRLVPDSKCGLMQVLGSMCVREGRQLCVQNDPCWFNISVKCFLDSFSAASQPHVDVVRDNAFHRAPREGQQQLLGLVGTGWISSVSWWSRATAALTVHVRFPKMYMPKNTKLQTLSAMSPLMKRGAGSSLCSPEVYYKLFSLGCVECRVVWTGLYSQFLDFRPLGKLHAVTYQPEYNSSANLTIMFVPWVGVQSYFYRLYCIASNLWSSSAEFQDRRVMRSVVQPVFVPSACVLIHAHVGMFQQHFTENDGIESGAKIIIAHSHIWTWTFQVSLRAKRYSCVHNLPSLKCRWCSNLASHFSSLAPLMSWLTTLVY